MKLPLFTFRFLGKPDNTLGDIEVREGNSPEIIQRIRYPRYGYQGAGLESPEDALTTLDADFDGYKDLQVYVQCGTVGNCTYDYYLYDPKTNRFVRNAFLSQLTMPQFNSAQKSVTSYWHVSAGDGGHETYRYEAGQYVPIREVVDSWDRNNNTVTEKTYVRREGRLVLVRSKTSPF